MISLDDCSQNSMCGRPHMDTLHDLVRNVNMEGVEGALVECGVCGGGCVMAMGISQQEFNEDREIWLYDTFEGMPRPAPIDNSVGVLSNRNPIQEYDEMTARGEKWCYASLDYVKKNMDKINYNSSKIKYIEGDVMNTLNENYPDKISILRCDTDWYNSSKKELDVLYPLVQIGGFIILDDYYYWNGQHRAGNEWYEKYRNELSQIHDNGDGKAYIQKIK